MPDRFGEPHDPDPHECDNGWIDSEADHPTPCLECKPHLAPERRIRNLGQ